MKKWLGRLWPLLLVLCLGLIFDGIGRLLYPVPDLTFAQTESIEIRLSNAVIRQAVSRAWEELDGRKWKTDPDLPASVRACSENDIIFYRHQGLPLAEGARQEILDLIPKLRRRSRWPGLLRPSAGRHRGKGRGPGPAAGRRLACAGEANWKTGNTCADRACPGCKASGAYFFRRGNRCAGVKNGS